MAQQKTVTATVVQSFMVAGEMAEPGDEVELTQTDADNLLYRGKITFDVAEEEGAKEEEEEE